MTSQSVELTQSQIVKASFSFVIESAERFFATQPSLLLHGVFSMQTHVLSNHRTVVDHTDTTRIHDALIVRWIPNGRLPLPIFEGSLTVRPSSLATDLTLQGSYQPPLSGFGRQFDRLFGYHIARFTMRILMQDLRNFIELDFKKFQSGCLQVPGPLTIHTAVSSQMR